MKEVMGKFAKSLRQGQTLYLVRALGKYSYITKMIVQSRATIVNSKYSYIIVTYSLDDGFTDRLYLGDANALNGTNNYNNHRVFFSNKKALNYLKLCIELELDVKYDKFLYDNNYYSDIRKLGFL